MRTPRLVHVLRGLACGRRARVMTIQRILVVDDDAFVLARVGDALRAEGYFVVAAPSAARALDLVKQQRFDLVISDIEMPRLDGLEFCDNLRSNPRTASIPFLFLTALDTEDNRRVAAELGVRHVLGKPVEPSRFFAAVREAIAGGVPAPRERSGPAFPTSGPTPTPLPNRMESSAGVAALSVDSGTVLRCVTCGGTYVLGNEVADERLLVECPPCLAHVPT